MLLVQRYRMKELVYHKSITPNNQNVLLIVLSSMLPIDTKTESYMALKKISSHSHMDRKWAFNLKKGITKLQDHYDGC